MDKQVFVFPKITTFFLIILVVFVTLFQTAFAGTVPVRDFFFEKKYSVKIDGNREIYENANGLLFEFQHFNKMFQVDKYVYFFNDLPTRKDNALLITDEDFDFLIRVTRFYEERQQQQKEASSPSALSAKNSSAVNSNSPVQATGSSEPNKSDLKKTENDATVENVELNSNSSNPSLDSANESKKVLDSSYTSPTTHKIDYIFLDAGHGGRDPGASFYGFIEKDLTLEIVKEFAQVLQNLNPEIKVVLTRSDDTYLTLQDRCEIANNTLKSNENGIFISVHFNVWVDPKARGIEAFYLTGSETVIQRKTYHHLEDLGEEKEGYFKKVFSYLKVIQYQNESRYLSDSIMKNIRDINDSVPRGSKYETFYVLKGALMPAVLLELGFISNREDMELISDKEKRKVLLDRVGQAIMSYTEDFEKSNGFRDGLYFSQLNAAQ